MTQKSVQFTQHFLIVSRSSCDLNCFGVCTMFTQHYSLLSSLKAENHNVALKSHYFSLLTRKMKWSSLQKNTRRLLETPRRIFFSSTAIDEVKK